MAIHNQFFLFLFSAFFFSLPASGNSILAPSGEKEVVCFVYHRFGDDRYAATNVSLENFRAHLSYLKDNGYRVLTFSDAIEYLNSDEPARKTAVITIDDGFKTFYENGLPILQEYNFPATVFINTETVGGNEYMGWAELKDAMDQDVEIGNHTHSHPYILNLPEKERYETFRAELKKCQQLIQENLDVIPQAFAYPYGEWDLKMRDIVGEMGFKAAAAQNSGVISPETDLLLCPRFPMSESYAAPEKFASKARMHAFPVDDVKPVSPILEDNMRPKLSLRTDPNDLQLSQLQCFVQGGSCNILQNENGSVSVQAAADLSGRRRTLYTLTAPDKNGNWHWYSHLWIHPDVK